MPFHELIPDFETFLEPTRILLFGKHFNSLVYEPTSMSAQQTGTGGTAAETEWHTYNAAGATAPLPMPPPRLERKLRGRDGATVQIFARIYSFSFEGHYYKMPRPLLFLVSGAGNRFARPEEVDPTVPPGAGATAANYTDRHVAFNTKFTGIETKEWNFSDDIRVWAVDRKDLAVCLDVEIGNYQEVLLNPMVAWSRGGAARGEMSSRGETSFRGEMSSRGEMGSRGEMSSRGEIIGPHHNR